jgi:type III pantothenate kinase
MNENMKIFCIDIGNTHTHFGVVLGNECTRVRETPTRSLDAPDGPLTVAIQTFASGAESPAFSFCSVVPEASERLAAIFRRLGLGDRIFQLTCRARLGMTISYPKPEEIGQDRLANAVAASAFHQLPCIVIDMGTAVTFDIVTASGGYEGGIIAPGLRIMTRYLHEQTALLPDLDEDFEVTGAIGHSTREAMKIGCLIGFGGMIRSLLEAVTQELTRRGEKSPTLIGTGGTARFLQESLRQDLIEAPAITLQGLAQAYRLNRHAPEARA